MTARCSIVLLSVAAQVWWFGLKCLECKWICCQFEHAKVCRRVCAIDCGGSDAFFPTLNVDAPSQSC